MHSSQRDRLWINLNRLAFITGILVLLKVFTYFFQEFLPIFGEALTMLLAAFLPFILALVFAFLLEPLVNRVMVYFRIKRTYASVVILVSTLAVLGLFLFLIIARLYTELSELAESLPNYGYFADFVSRQIDSVEKFITVNPQVQSALTSSTESLLKSVQDWAKSGSMFLLNFLAALPGIFIVLVISIVATLLISSSFPRVKHFLQGLLPVRWHSKAHVVSKDLGAAIVGFLRAEAILVSLTALFTIGGLLLIGNRYAVTLGVLAGILDLVPVVGTGMLFVPWIAGLFFAGAVGEGIKILVVWGLTVILRQLLEPKILSHSIGLQPLPTLISMYVGLKLLGGIGLIAGPVVVIIYEALRKAGVFTGPKH